MSKDNPLWGAPRIHGELLKLGFELAQSTVSKYMIRCPGPSSQTWRTFLRNHADVIAAIDLCVVPTLTFERLFALLVIGHSRRQSGWRHRPWRHSRGMGRRQAKPSQAKPSQAKLCFRRYASENCERLISLYLKLVIIVAAVRVVKLLV